jgi:hypothetical protein
MQLQQRQKRQRQRPQYPPASPFAARMLAQFDALDTNRDGILNEREVDAAVANPQIQGENAAALAALKMSMRNKKMDVERITREELQRRLMGAKGEINYEKLYQGSLSRIRRGRERLFTQGIPHLTTVQQGHIGDCFFIAPLGCAVARNPERVRQMISENDDGTVTVRFPGSKPVTVTPPTDTELGLLSTSGGDGTWVPLLEKALGEVRNQGRKNQADTATDLIASGGATKNSIELLSGNDAKTLRIRSRQRKGEPPSPEEQAEVLTELRRLLPAVLRDGRLACAGTPERVDVPNINPRHAYAILGFDAARDLLHLWNPHGDKFRPKGAPGLQNGYPAKDGAFVLPLTHFVLIFGGMSYETRR